MLKFLQSAVRIYEQLNIQYAFLLIMQVYLQAGA